MNTWSEVAKKRGAIHAANELLWILIERDDARGDESLHAELEVARKRKHDADLEYVLAKRRAVLSGRPHPNEAP